LNGPEHRFIPEETARAIWRRAAQLQAETAQRMEERSRSLARRGAEGPGGAGFHRADIEAAAVEAGISPEFVRLAIAEMEDPAGPATRLSGWQDRAASRMLTEHRSIDLTRTIAAPPSEVLAAMQRVFPAHPYDLALCDVVGGNPLEDGVLVFNPPGYNWWSPQSASTFGYYAAGIDLEQVRVTIRPVGDGDGEPEACEVSLSADLHRGVRRNWRLALGLGGAGGAFGTVVGAFVGMVAALPAALLALPAAAGAAVIGGGVTFGYGALWRAYYRKARRLLEELLQRLDANARTGGSFAPPQPGKAGDGGSSAAINPLLS
jgi:hypothetical protein